MSMAEMIERGGYKLFEADGWFWLYRTGGAFSMNQGEGDFGRGSSDESTRFQTAAERSGYIQIEYMRGIIGRLESEIQYLKTVRGANRNLREVRAKRKAEV